MKFYDSRIGDEEKIVWAKYFKGLYMELIKVEYR